MHLPSRYVLTPASISAEGAQVSGHAIDVKAGSTPKIKLILVGGTTAVEGIAKRSGKAVAGAMIVLVPKNPELNRDAFRRDQSDLDGTFSLPGVIPGSTPSLRLKMVGTYTGHSQA
ncbi:MAG: hypothetical protein NVS1B11_25930 [Terriglobales bacterium]